MELLLTLDICEELAENDALEITDAEREMVLREAELEGVESVGLVNIGPGADYYVFLLLLSLGLSAIKLGADINDGIEGWRALGEKLRRLFERRRVVSVDAEGATALAIALLAQKEQIERLEKRQEMTLNLVDVSGMIPGNRGLSQKPHNYYIQSYLINSEELYVVGIKSNGQTEILKHFGYSPYGVMERSLD